MSKCNNWLVICKVRQVNFNFSAVSRFFQYDLLKRQDTTIMDTKNRNVCGFAITIDFFFTTPVVFFPNDICTVYVGKLAFCIRRCDNK